MVETFSSYDERVAISGSAFPSSIDKNKHKIK